MKEYIVRCDNNEFTLEGRQDCYESDGERKMNKSLITKDRCIDLIDKWLTTIHNTAIDGELKLTEQGTEALIHNLTWIRSVFERQYENHNVVGITDTFTSEEAREAFEKGLATVKWDGSCCAIIDGELYKRYDAKKGKTPPEGAIPCCEADPVTGHWGLEREV